jgi:hypothetical protein
MSTLVLPIPIDVLEAVRRHAEGAGEVDGQRASHAAGQPAAAIHH